MAYPFDILYSLCPLPACREQVHETYVNGNDPVTGKPIMQEIVDALTKPLTADEQLTGLPVAALEPRLLPPDTEENLQELFKEKDWTDYLPVVLPTEERVAAMLKGTSHKPDEVVKTMSLAGRWTAAYRGKGGGLCRDGGSQTAIFPGNPGNWLPWHPSATPQLQWRT